MPTAFASLLAVRERFDSDIRAGQYKPVPLQTLRRQCGEVTAWLLSQAPDGAILGSEPEAFTVVRTVWLIKRYIQAYNRTTPLAWGDIWELYELKHVLLTHIVCAPPSQWCRWEVGQATDIRTAISVRLYFKGLSEWNTLVHWPMQHVPAQAQVVIRAATGSWPPPAYITYR